MRQQATHQQVAVKQQAVMQAAMQPALQSGIQPAMRPTVRPAGIRSMSLFAVQRQRALTWLLALFAAAILAGCGFQLRGQANFDFEAIGRDGMSGTNMARTLDRLMQVYGLKVNAGQSEAVITLLGESVDRSILTFSATGRAEEVRLIYSVRYRVKDAKGKFLIADTVISQDRDLTYDDGQILGKELEEGRLIQEMQNDISRQLVRRLSALKLKKG